MIGRLFHFLYEQSVSALDQILVDTMELQICKFLNLRYSMFFSGVWVNGGYHWLASDGFLSYCCR